MSPCKTEDSTRKPCSQTNVWQFVYLPLLILCMWLQQTGNCNAINRSGNKWSEKNRKSFIFILFMCSIQVSFQNSIHFEISANNNIFSSTQTFKHFRVGSEMNYATPLTRWKESKMSKQTFPFPGSWIKPLIQKSVGGENRTLLLSLCYTLQVKGQLGESLHKTFCLR